MKIGIIDADLISQKNHNFPNLALMKLSGYYKAFGHDVKLINYDNINPNAFFPEKYDKVFISKVFSDSIVPQWVFDLDFVEYGGTGFFYDKAPKLKTEIEHHFPDYHLYDKWVKYETRINKKNKNYFKYYTDFSIGFTTRGCFRQCEFCVNKNEKKVYSHSPLNEFYDTKRKKVCLLDDNVFGYIKWEEIFVELQNLNIPFEYKQGLDIRILTEKKAEILSKSKYVGDYIFAFDNYKDKEIIERKIKIFKKYLPKKIPKFYVFCAFDRDDLWNEEFWKKDICEIFERLNILMKNQCIPYIMLYEKYRNSPYEKIYRLIKSWCNTPAIFKKKSFNEFLKLQNYEHNLKNFLLNNKEISKKYFNLKYIEKHENQ